MYDIFKPLVAGVAIHFIKGTDLGNAGLVKLFKHENVQ